MKVIRRRQTSVLIGVAVIAYVAITYWLYHGPLQMLSNGFWQVIWNYAVVIVFIGIIWTVTRFMPKPDMPIMPATKLKLSILLGAPLVYILMLIYFWIRLVSHPWPLLVHIDHSIEASTLLDSTAQGTVINALFGIWITLIVTAIVLWQMWKWRKTVFSFSWQQLAFTIVLILVSTGFAALLSHWFPHPLFPSEGLLNVIVILVAQFFVNGFLEETFFRGYVFPKLIAYLRYPWLAWWLMMALFDASHIPSDVIGHSLHSYVTYWGFPFM